MSVENAVPESFTQIGFAGVFYVIGIVIIIGAILAVVGWCWFRVSDDLFASAVAILGSVVAVGGIIVLAVALVPYSTKHLYDYRVEGNIVSVSNVLTGASGELTHHPVVVLSTVDRPLVVSDARVTQLEGKDVALTCNIIWNFRAADTYTCRIAGVLND